MNSIPSNLPSRRSEAGQRPERQRRSEVDDKKAAEQRKQEKKKIKRRKKRKLFLPVNIDFTDIAFAVE